MELTYIIQHIVIDDDGPESYQPQVVTRENFYRAIERYANRSISFATVSNPAPVMVMTVVTYDA